MRVIFFLKTFNLNLGHANKSEKIFFVSEIIALENVKKIILIIGSQWVNKEP